MSSSLPSLVPSTAKWAFTTRRVEKSDVAGLSSELARAVAGSGDADIGFAQDPDADRLAIVDENGRYIGEELTLVLAARRMLQVHGPGVLVANLSTSRDAR